MKRRQPTKRPTSQLRKQIVDLAVEVQRRTSHQSGKLSGHLTHEFGPRVDFFNLLKHPNLASLPSEQITMLKRIAEKLDSVSPLKSGTWKEKLQNALDKPKIQGK